MSVQKEPAACSIRSGEQTASSIQLNKPYRKLAPLSSENLRDQVGLLLWFLCSPISEGQSASGWRLFEVLLRGYVGGRLERGRIR